MTTIKAGTCTEAMGGSPMSLNDNEFDFTQLFSRENILANVLPKVISAENEPSVRDRGVFCERFLDMYVTFYILMEQGGPERKTATLCSALLESQRIGAKELLDAAIRNMSAEIELCPLDDVLREMGGGYEDDIINSPFWIITNRDKVDGAAGMLCQEYLNKAERIFGAPVALLPSSVHEVLVLCYTSGMEDILKEMVVSINRSEVAPKDRLSDSVYLYSSGHLSIIA